MPDLVVILSDRWGKMMFVDVKAFGVSEDQDVGLFIPPDGGDPCLVTGKVSFEEIEGYLNEGYLIEDIPGVETHDFPRNFNPETKALDVWVKIW